jgi:hypothetical protein
MDTAIAIMAVSTSIAFFGGLTILPLLCIFRKTRRFAGICYVVSSFLFGFVLWVMCALTVYAAWGGFAVFIGTMVLGVGVVPMTLWILIRDAQWFNLADVALLGFSLAGSRFLGVWLIERRPMDLR